MAATTSIVELARGLLTHIEILDIRMKSAGQPDLSLGLGGGKIPEDDPMAQMSKNIALSKLEQLTWLLQGPSALHVIWRNRIAESFPVGSTTTYADIASDCKLPKSQVQRILEYSMTSGFFCELRPGIVGHTAISAALVQDPAVRADTGQMLDEQFGACAHMAEAIQQYPATEEPQQSGWAIANRSSQPMFAELQSKHVERARQFSRFMDHWATKHPVRFLVDTVDWSPMTSWTDSSLPPHLPHFVDIGGGKGHVSIALASSESQVLSKYIFTVQDYPDTIAGAVDTPPVILRDRIRYMAHDFLLESQPVQGADVYFFRSVFHDWPDKYCIQILRNLIPALKPGSRVILNEMCVTVRPMIPPIKRVTRALDIVMLSLFNGQERSVDDFARLFKAADPRFEFLGGTEPEFDDNGVPTKGLMSVIEARWTE